MSNANGAMSSSGRDISAPPGLPDGWKATQHHDTDSSDSSSVGRSYVRFHSVDGKHKNIPTAKQAIRIHCSFSFERFTWSASGDAPAERRSFTVLYILYVQ